MKSPHIDAKNLEQPVMLIACEILPVDAAHGHTNKQWFYITEDNFKCIMWGEPLPWEKNFNTQKSVSEVPRSTFCGIFFQAQCLALTHPHSYFLVLNDQCLLCSDQASQLSPALPISCFPTSRHRCESLLWVTAARLSNPQMDTL